MYGRNKLRLRKNKALERMMSDFSRTDPGEIDIKLIVNDIKDQPSYIENRMDLKRMGGFLKRRIFRWWLGESLPRYQEEGLDAWFGDVQDDVLFGPKNGRIFLVEEDRIKSVERKERGWKRQTSYDQLLEVDGLNVVTDIVLEEKLFNIKEGAERPTHRRALTRTHRKNLNRKFEALSWYFSTTNFGYTLIVNPDHAKNTLFSNFKERGGMVVPFCMPYQGFVELRDKLWRDEFSPEARSS